MERETGMDLTRETNGLEVSSSMVIGTHDNSNTPSLKRQRFEKSRIENSYPRKRALRACQVCRARKTKCNNEKPVCGCCQALGAQCVYDEANGPYTLDFASQIIVERLDQVLQKLDERGDSAETLRRISQELGTFRSEQVSLKSKWQAPSTNGEVLESEKDHELQLDENMLTPSARTSPDAVLDWPVFESHYPTGFITRYLFDQNFVDDSRPEESEHDDFQPSALINEEAVPQLVEIFLTRVHTKSPILDPKTAREFGFKIALEGLRWDASSCLVLIMCALGCVSQPFSDSQSRILPENRMETSRSALGERNLSLGTACFTAARKRIGLLKPSVIATQCIFLCGVYEMYMVRPLRAWNSFADASSNLFMYLKCEESHFGGDISRTKSPEIQRVEASLYWSCYKSMCELRTEVPLPTSVLSQVNYAHSLPEPPTNFASGANSSSYNTNSAESSTVNDSRQEVSEVAFETLQEQAWFFLSIRYHNQ
ncbi:5e7ae012-43b4-4d56-8d92-b6af33ec6736 [Sclerotinia trifoliorum]|uniref:5e7ae012-43b4-4d56-8d92-b6af33ec6736 n=1 Tax=Sclerotinia trifoliorum TaxID=28548 RepID=A0A8H2ZMR5_9HELO|nr:5e7ae012-43b4-4d56-8d92-b6af33ec6736 [Sclerotinia trifoliorum]